MRTLRFKTRIDEAGRITLPKGADWEPGEAQVIVFQDELLSGKELLQFAGILSDDEATAIREAVEAACEQTDADAW